MKKKETHSVAVRALSNNWVTNTYTIGKEEFFYDDYKKIPAIA